MKISVESQGDTGRTLNVEALSFFAIVRVGCGREPRIEIREFVHRSGVPGALPKERAAIRRVVKKWVAENPE